AGPRRKLPAGDYPEVLFGQIRVSDSSSADNKSLHRGLHSDSGYYANSRDPASPYHPAKKITEYSKSTWDRRQNPQILVSAGVPGTQTTRRPGRPVLLSRKQPG